MNRLVWKLLRQHISIGQLTGFFLANIPSYRRLALHVQFLCRELAERCGQHICISSFEEHKVAVICLFQCKVNAVLFGSLGKGFDIRVGDFDIGNAGAVTHKLFQRLFATVGRIPFLSVKLHELSQCCLQHLSVQLCRLNCKCNGLTCNFFLQNVPPFAALQVPL